MKRIKKNLKKRSGRTILSLLLAVALAVGGMTTAFATEEDPNPGAVVTENAVEADADSTSVNTDKLNATVTDGEAEDADAADDTFGAGDGQESGAGDASLADTDTPDETADIANIANDAEETPIDDANEAARAANSDYDPSYGLYGGYDGQDSMDDPESAGSCVGWDIATMSAITADSGLWWIDDYYVGESSQYDVSKTDDFSLKYQIEFHASEDIEAGSVSIVIDASLGTYRNGNNIIPTELGIPYGTPDSYTTSSSSPFNYYYIDKDGDILTESEAKSAEGVQIVVWNYRDIEGGSNAVFQVLYKSMNVMQIPDGTEWALGVSVEVTTDAGTKAVTGNTLSGDVDTEVKLNSVTKKAYTATSKSYTPELYTKSQVNSYINGSMGEPYASDFDDYIYMVWQVSFSGTTTQAFTITVDDSTIADSVSGSVVGYMLSTSSGLSTQYGSSDNPSITFTSGTNRSYSATFYVVTAYEKDTYTVGDTIDNTVTVTAEPADGIDADIPESASASSSWGEYNWQYRGNGISIKKYYKYVNSQYLKTGTYNAYMNLYETNAKNEKDTGEITFKTETTDRGYSYTHYTANSENGDMGEWKEGSYYKTTVVDDALYAYPNELNEAARMLGKDDYYFSSVSVSVSDTGYDVWEDTSATAEKYDGIDQSVYIYAMYYDVSDDADIDGWEYVTEVPFSAGTMKYTFTDDDLARQPYRMKVVHNTANYSTSIHVDVGVTLRYDSPIIAGFEETYGDALDTLKIENLYGVAGQVYGNSDYQEGAYFQDTSGSNYSEKDTVTGETLKEFTETLYGTILIRDNAYGILTRLEETASANKAVELENDTANSRVLANYYLTAYEGYYVTGEDTVSALKEAGFALPERHEVAYYDLLPYGMQFNANAPVTAGRITSMNSSGTWKKNSGAWNKSDVSVSVGEEDVITNWHGTGRTMVVFHITYSGDDAGAFYDVPANSSTGETGDNDLWYEGFGIAFQAYYDWTEMDVVDTEYNIAAYIEEDDNEFLGNKDENIFKDDGSANLNSRYAPFEGVSDLNGDGITDLYTNMYCSASTSTNVATASSDSITKTVRADDDAVAEYGKIAVVSEGHDYTYEITLKNNTGSTLSDVVIFDRLEYAVEDGRADVETSSGSVYTGLTGSEIDDHWTGTYAGITTTALSDIGIAPVVYYNANRDAIVTSEETDPSDILTATYGWYTEDEFIAEYGSLSYVQAIAIDISTGTDGKPYVLDQDTDVSVMIHMTAPSEVPEGYLYAFNNPIYYSVSTDALGNSISATDVGTSTRVELGEAGTFEVEKVTEGDIPSEMANVNFTFMITRDYLPLANMEYTVYTRDGDEWVSTGVVSATDTAGRFTLKAGQKAVFSKLTNVDAISVSEVESVFWASGEEEYDGGVTYTNTYRSPVYLYKTAETTDLATEEELANAQFTFQLLVDTDGDGGYEPYANGEYLYVKEVLTDGSSPTIDTSKGDSGHGWADANGYVTLTLSDIIAFFPCDSEGNYVGVAYKIVESDLSADGDWVCFNNEASGKTTAFGRSVTITNYYKYRNLIITKDLSDYDHDLADCEDEWTFKLTDADGQVVTGNHWYMIDADGNPIEGVEGYLDENGEFTFSGAGSGRRIVIEKLVEGEEYILTETDYDAELYEQVNDGTVDTTMPVYSISRSITITNKYLLKDLSVEKLVLTGEVNDEIRTHEFTFTLEKYNGEADEYEPASGAVYTVDGIEYETDENGQFTLRHGETAYFDDIGYQGDKYRVTESVDGDYIQIYPADGAPYEGSLSSDGASARFINGDFENVVSLTKNLVGLDEVGEAYVDLVKGDNTMATLVGEEEDIPYTVEVTFGVYDGDTCVAGDTAGTLIDYVSNNPDYPYVYIKVCASGEYTVYSYTGGVMTEELAPYDYIYIAEIGDYTVKVSESANMERVLLDVTGDVADEIGSDEILSEGDVMSGSAAANENIALVNNISSANKASEIYKLMTKTSEEVPTGSQITFIVQIYDEATDTWSPASGIKYITMEGCTGVTKDGNGVLTSHDTENAAPTSGVLTTGSDGKITLTKTDEGYPYIRFIEDVVYANVYEGMEDGTLRIVETSSGTDEAWGLLVGYDGEGWVGGPALDITYADTFYNGNDTAMQFEVEKEMADDTECDDDFTFYLRQIISASTSPITSMDEILESEVGADIYYILCDVESGQMIGDGYTDANGAFTLKPGQYAVFYVPDDTSWYVYEGVNPGYPLYDVTANSDVADNASIVDETNGVVQNEHSVYATAKITLTLTDKDTDEPLAGGVFTLYQDGVAIKTELTTDENGQIVIDGLTAGEYYFKETEAPDGYDLPSNAVSDTVNVASSLTKAESYDLTMTNEETVVPVKYAVKLWGICADTYSYDDGATTGTASLTFGPATGANHLSNYVECESDTCIHKLSWDEIITYCNQYQGNETKLTELFGSCLENGCTKSVNLEPNETLFNMTTVDNYMSNSSYTGDGVSTLYYLLNGTGSSSYTYAAIWNCSYTGYSSSDPANIYSRSRIRTTLTGDRSNIDEWLTDNPGANDYYGRDTLCDTSNCLLSCFPSNLQEAMVPRKTLNSGNATGGSNMNADTKTTYDELFLFSLKETGISYSYDDAGGDDYGVNASDSDRVAYEFSGTGATASSSQYWWSRSRGSNNVGSACLVNTRGSYNSYFVSFGYGLSPGFCIE